MQNHLGVVIDFRLPLPAPHLTATTRCKLLSRLFLISLKQAKQRTYKTRLRTVLPTERFP